MVERVQEASNAGDQASNTPSYTQLPQEGLASINRRLEQLTAAVKDINKPPLMNAGNVIALVSTLFVLALAALGAFALSDRINAVNDHIEHIEDRLAAKLDKLSDQFMKMDERTSVLEGRLTAAPASQAPGSAARQKD